MATTGKGTKRAIYFTCSTGKIGEDLKCPSSWQAGRSRNKKFKEKKK